MSKDLVFSSLNPFVDINFWQDFANLKLEKLKLDDKPMRVFGTYTLPVSSSAKVSILSISEKSLPESNTKTIGGLIESKVEGTFHNVNTLEQYKEADRKTIAGTL